jgi:DNA-binding transcriptional LysR family regulator
MPRLAPLLRDYPDITLEFDINYGFRDIVADRFDAGVRIGRTIDKDMVAVPIGPPLRMAWWPRLPTSRPTASPGSLAT